MNILKISDASFAGYTSIDFFYPTPKTIQDLGRSLFRETLGKELQTTTLEGLVESSLNRHLFIELKIGEHPQIVKNILNYCKTNKIERIECLLHKNNHPLMTYYMEVFSDAGIKISADFHKEKVYWENSLTKKSRGLFIKAKVILTLLGQLLLLSLNTLRGKGAILSGKKFVFWNSFANNREKIDFSILNELEKNTDYIVIHPNPYLIFSKNNWNKSLYWLKDLSLNPLEFCSFLKISFNFRKKINFLLKKYEAKLGKLPSTWNRESLSKLFFFLEYNFFMGNVTKKLIKFKQNKVINIYRGGAAAGLVYSGFHKKKHKADHITNILVPHGTEFFPIDHFSYFFMDFNVLPSQLIVDQWNSNLKDEHSDILHFNQSTNVAGGRIDYDYLRSSVIPRKTVLVNIPKTFNVGIVLTYNSDNYQNEYIAEAIESFNKAYAHEHIKFIVKPRPNLPLHPKLKSNKQIHVHHGDIVSFLNTCNLVIGTLSTYGVLSMVVTDSIYCKIPAIYFIPSKNISSGNLGYSYHPSMRQYCFYSKEELTNFLMQTNSSDLLLNKIIEINAETNRMLKHEGSAATFLERLISTL